MELKDVILSTLAELEEGSKQEVIIERKESELPTPIETLSMDISPDISVINTDSVSSAVVNENHRDEEIRLLEGIRERLLVLFEGFQSPNNVQLEAKVDLTLNFLEYLLASIENRLDSIK